MKPARIIILAVAVLAAGMAGVLVMRLTGGQSEGGSVEAVVEREPTINVLVSAANLPVGTRLNDESMRWMPWPEGGIVEGFITEQSRPDALKDLQGAVVRLPIFEGEPLRAEKIADSSSRILSSLLPSGKRAVSTEITVATGAGGFILPNDRVDVIMVRKAPEQNNYLTETVLTNVRVLAIDQAPKEKEGQNALVGRTVTLELKPDQAETLARSRQAGTLSLALRSITDINMAENNSEDDAAAPKKGASINVVRFGVQSSTTTQK